MAPTAVDTGVVRAALLARREEVLAQLDTMTLKAVRRQLEHDLGLNKDGLKPFKDTISAGIDEVSRRARRRGSAARKGGDLAPPLRRRSSRSTPSRRRPSPLGARRHRARTRRQALGASAARWRQRGARLLRQRQQVRASPAGHASGWCQLRSARRLLLGPPPPPTHTHACAAAPRQFSKRVERLRKICRQATVAIPPTVYRNKDDDALVAALEALLDKHGVSTHAGAARS